MEEARFSASSRCTPSLFLSPLAPLQMVGPLPATPPPGEPVPANDLVTESDAAGTGTAGTGTAGGCPAASPAAQPSPSSLPLHSGALGGAGGGAQTVKEDAQAAGASESDPVTGVAVAAGGEGLPCHLGVQEAVEGGAAGSGVDDQCSGGAGGAHQLSCGLAGAAGPKGCALQQHEEGQGQQLQQQQLQHQSQHQHQHQLQQGLLVLGGAAEGAEGSGGGVEVQGAEGSGGGVGVQGASGTAGTCFPEEAVVQGGRAPEDLGTPQEALQAVGTVLASGEREGTQATESGGPHANSTHRPSGDSLGGGK